MDNKDLIKKYWGDYNDRPESDSVMWPVYYNGEWWSKWRAKTIFKNHYHTIHSLRADGAVYVGDGSWVFPDDSFEHDDNR
jgi:hypothetical protein